MGQTANNSGLSGRQLALARRRAMSSGGKAAIGGASAPTRSTAAPAKVSTPTANVSAAARAPSGSGRAASRARRAMLSKQGRSAVASSDRVRDGSRKPNVPGPQASNENIKKDCGCGCQGRGDCGRDTAPDQAPGQAASDNGLAKRNRRMPVKKVVNGSSSRAAALARRKAQSTRGKAGLSANGMSAAQTARAANPQMSGRELAQALRSQRSQRGGAGQKKSAPTGRVRPTRESATGAAQDASWKVGASETSHGQTVTGTMVGRSHRVTGDEPSTCRGVTGTEYLGADIFRDFCQTEPSGAPRKVSVSPTTSGNAVTGNEVGRSTRVTGDEPGTCKSVTGTEYLGADQSDAFCGTPAVKGPSKITLAETHKGKAVTGNNVGRSTRVTGDEVGSDRELTGTQYMMLGQDDAPAKVGMSDTLRGGAVTGTMVGRGAKVTGDEPGSCRNVTGDDYVGQEQYQDFCASTPAPQDDKVGVSATLKGEAVTGTMTGRSSRVTGDEPGTCKAVTGTPYAGAEQYREYCDTDDAGMAAARTRQLRSTPGSVMTGLQPGVGGKTTGDRKGACEPLTGTPYVGADQFADACPATPAQPGSPDFPQPVGDAAWGGFSVNTPSHASQQPAPPAMGDVTGTRYEQGQITGPFGMASGKVTGTEEARFGNPKVMPTLPPAEAQTVEGRVKARITGEGQDAGLKVTGDDWERGDHVTGTEGNSATRRNPTLKGGPMSAMINADLKRNESLPEPSSKVTGGSGNTEKGALITYSGGARG